MALKWLKRQLPVLFIYQEVPGLIVRGSIILHGRFLSLNRLGVGCVGLASVHALASPPRNRGASYHLNRESDSTVTQDFQIKTLPKFVREPAAPRSVRSKYCRYSAYLNRSQIVRGSIAVNPPRCRLEPGQIVDRFSQLALVNRRFLSRGSRLALVNRRCLSWGPRVALANR
jgi:hypothetical protein